MKEDYSNVALLEREESGRNPGQPESHDNTEKSAVKFNLIIIIMGIMALIIVALAAAAVILGIKYKENEEYIAVEIEKTYEFFTRDDYIILEDGYYGPVWIPVLTDVPKASYDYGNLAFENGRYTYSENGTQTSFAGIDASYHQGAIDWQKVSEDGIDFAIIRVGYRGYEYGLIRTDERFHENIQGALDAGLEVGVYFYSQALSAAEAIEEADFVLSEISEYDITYPVAFDWEIAGAEEARTNRTDPFILTEAAAAFCERISSEGYIPMIYGSKKQLLMKMDLSSLRQYDFWFAEYKDGYTEPSYGYDFQIWQYASDGRVEGIDSEVDLNISFVDYKEKRR